MARNINFKTNKLHAAPQIQSQSEIYDLWHKYHFGSADDFYKFMTTPSADRSMMLRTASFSVVVDQNSIIKTYKTKE